MVLVCVHALQTFRDGNPFSGSTRQNCNEACCAKRQLPLLRPRALASEPDRLDTCHLIRSGDGLEVAPAQALASGPDEAAGGGGLRTAPPLGERVPDV